MLIGRALIAKYAQPFFKLIACPILSLSQGFHHQLQKSPDATRGAVTESITVAAGELSSGDIFLLTYAGHGGQVKDMDGDEDDLKDETWCLYDGQLLDDELNILWAKFDSGVRILLLSDSCHSGSVSKGVSSEPEPAEEIAGALYRYMPRSAALATGRKNYEFYDNLQFDLPDPRPDINASVRLISGCLDSQKSLEQDAHGIFTTTLKSLWSDGKFDGNYKDFHRAIRESMPETQQPNHLILGTPNPAYDEQRPFKI